MIFYENRLLADDSHEISFLISKIRKDVAKFVVCCSHDWNLRVNSEILTSYNKPSLVHHIKPDGRIHLPLKQQEKMHLKMSSAEVACCK